MKRAYYSASIQQFLTSNLSEITNSLSQDNEFPLEITQRNAWNSQIPLLKDVLKPFTGRIYFEFTIPRVGKRIDVVLLIKHVIFVIEFKIGETIYTQSSLDQAMDYALDLKYFHETSQSHVIAPILVVPKANNFKTRAEFTAHQDQILIPIKANAATLQEAIYSAIQFSQGPEIDFQEWEKGRYSPTPTIIEAAMALYSNHSVLNITRTEASAKNLSETTAAIVEITRLAKDNEKKIICFVTGVPGAGKTLVGLNIATKQSSSEDSNPSVFLSGNDPLVNILREALARDQVRMEKSVKKGDASRKVKSFIQNVHHFRDDCRKDLEKAPIEHIAIFDEAQRAWNRDHTEKFMIQKKGETEFPFSEPHFLISCLDRHDDWAVIICLVGGGQEINTGEAGIGEWFNALESPVLANWEAHISSNIVADNYLSESQLAFLSTAGRLTFNDSLHLSVSMRSFRAENVSSLIEHLLELNHVAAAQALKTINKRYPIVLARDLDTARNWLTKRARGSERYGLVASSSAQRLKPLGIDVKSPIDPVHWFLNGKNDVRSSFYLEDIATEFQVQGLELDWVGLVWDADFRFHPHGWECLNFVGNRWNQVKAETRRRYLKNAYRVLLTRARQGMIIVVPEGNPEDPTRMPAYYDSTFKYLLSLGIPQI